MPLFTCTVSGVVASSDGVPYAGGVVSFTPLSGTVETSYDGSSTVVPEAILARANADGIISVDLNPGQYRVVVASREGNQVPYTVTVPPTATAFLHDLLDTPLPIPPSGRVPSGLPGQLVSYDSEGFPIAIDRPTGSGGSVSISADPNNALQYGNDGGLFVFETIGSDGGLDLTVLFDNQII